ncbi:MAG: T9SS type B sorting domain-containing protein, partial [Flavobacteriaceae bacterium]
GTGNCTFTVNNIVLAEAIEPVLEPIVPQNISCDGANDGSINATLQAGTGVDSPFDFRLLDFDTRALIANNATGSFSGLTPGRYEVEVVSSRGCGDMSGLLTIVEPVPFEISASAPDFTCEPGANRFSSTTLTVTVDPVDTGTTGNYRFSISGFENYQTSPDFEIIDNGSVQNITVYAIDANGCQATATVTINPPTTVTSAIVENDPLDCANPERVRIQVTGTNDFTVNTVSAFSVAPVTNTPGNDYVDVNLPSAGDYIFEIDDHVGGCTYPMPPYTVENPVSPNVVISEAKPVSCFTPGNDGQLSIEVTDYTGNYDYTVYFADDIAKTNPIANGTFNTSTNPELISGLPGGNLLVEVSSTNAPFCSSDSNATTIRTPNGDLEVTAIEVGNVSCNDNTGQIEATGTGGWDTAGYEFQLLRDDGDGAGFYVFVAFSTTSSFDNLSSGDYRVEIRDVEGCTDTFDINLPIVPQVNAGIREPQALVCPNGNTAVLEAYDPTTGDVLTATAGATGGYPGAGYNYRLLYLNGNDNTDVASTGGLQDSPTFIGDSGGYLSGGWYAIEVSSSFGCSFVTDPYYVNPPPPIEPKLVQTRVPGCGGDGEMRLFIENYDTNFTYEYRIVPTPDPINDPYTDMVGSEVFITGVAGITYQYEVRKKNTLNTCLPVLSNGVTMTNATGVTLLPNQPDDISCASELDGRIESFVNGGVGDNQYYLYQGDPVDAFNPAPAATLVRGGQDHGTFEGLDAATNYYIAVTSGTTCFDVAGPFEVSRPAPIVVNTTPTPTTCVGNADGTIRMEVVSGGEGWTQFAIGPHFNEFFSDPNTPGSYVFEDLAAGEYEVLIQDGNGCFETEMVTVGAPTEIQVLDVQTTPETCIGFSDGTAQLTVTGGTPFVDTATGATYYETKIIGSNPTGDEVFVRNDSLYFENLMGGEIYVVIIQDANFCDTDTVVSIEIGVDLTAETVPEYGCDGIFPNNMVTVAMRDTSLYPDLLFSLDVDDISVAGNQYTWGDLAPGSHTVYIYHSNGCYTFSDFTIEAYDPLTLTAIKTGPNEITATATGGYGDYEFFFEDNATGSTNVYHRNESGTVEVRVVDARGCTATVSLQFIFDGNLELPDFFTPDGDGHNDEWFPRNTNYFPMVEVKIYDRYGRVVAILDKVERWDGTYEGYPMPTGDYWYEVNANNKAKDQWIGHFTLLR